MSRYDKLLELIKVFQPATIAETGTWKGTNAVRMLKATGLEKPHYIGFDLFEEATPETDHAEFNIKPHNRIVDVEKFIKEHCPLAEISLVKGNTRQTLRPLIVDFAFIDGGHSLETIAHDYECLKGSSVVVFDDYYTPDSEGKMPDISIVGCNKLLEGIPHAVIPSTDQVKTGGIVSLAVVFGG
jgi:predicted O-methyltransferase YrrM